MKELKINLNNRKGLATLFYSRPMFYALNTFGKTTIDEIKIQHCKIGFVTKNKNLVVISKIHSDSSKQNFSKIINDNLLFDSMDIIEHNYNNLIRLIEKEKIDLLELITKEK